MLNEYNSNDEARAFIVSNPTKEGDNWVYQLSGKSPFLNQRFTVKRRFNEFYVLRNVMKERHPGLYVPALPEKKAFGSSTPEFLAERCYLLDKFVKNITRCPYLFSSEEFNAFLHPSQEIT